MSEPTRAPARALPPSGAGMDTPIVASRWRHGRTAALVALLAAGALVALWRAAPSLAEGSQTLRADRTAVAAVTQGRFDDFIPLRGQAAPLVTVYLDAIEGGRVERKWVEDGALVRAGQPIAQLSNSSLQLEVIRSESEVTAQLNSLRSIELQIERNRADNARLLVELGWQLKRSADKAAREQNLASAGFISAAATQDADAEHRYLTQRLEITQASQRTDERLQSAQAEQLGLATRKLQANLALARANLDALSVKAPIDGQLTAFEVTVGQSLTRGQRIGQIDSADAAKLVASIDEFYLSRVAVGQTATLESNGKTYALRVRKLNPQVRAGQFEAELVFSDGQPAGLRRGQTLQARLALGESQSALLLPTGAYLADNGGTFVFVVDGDAAHKRPVQLGRRNVNFVEVLGGVKAGERVLVSSYAGLTDKDRLVIAP
jgi:HlyD family secretion protein